MMIKSYDFKVGGQSFTAQIVEYTETKVVVELNGNIYEVELPTDRPTPRPAPVNLPPRPAATPPIPIHERSTHAARPAPTPAAQTAAPSPSSAPHGLGDVTAPIPGVVKRIAVAVGDQVAEGDVVLILESMKMENEIAARASGKISDIKVGLGDSVQEGQLLIQIEVS